MPKHRRCFNCKAEDDMTRLPFCQDCLRMAVICLGLGSVNGEMVHKLIAFLFQ